MDMNCYWHNRYRAADGNEFWGSRAGLKFVNGQTTKDVLEHELSMLDVMTANRAPKMWATAKCKDYKVDDSNAPKPVEAVSNVGGGSPSSSAAKEGSSDYLIGKERLAKLHVPKRFDVNLFADESMFAPTYVWNSWGNNASAASADTAKNVRAETSNRSIFWKPEGLLKDHPMK